MTRTDDGPGAGAGRRVARPGSGATSPAGVPPTGWRQILVRSWHEQDRDGIGVLAGAVAYFGFLAIFPAIVAGLSLWGLVLDPDTAVEQVGAFTSQLPPGAGDVVDGQLADISSAASSGLTFGLVLTVVLALWSASGGTNTMIKALNVAYGVSDGRGFVRGRALALLVTVGAVVFVLLALALVAILPAVLGAVDLGPVTRALVQVARWLVLAVVALVALAVLYRVGPDRRTRFRWVSPGAVLALLLWLPAGAGFSLYVSTFGSYGETYGAVAGAAVLLLWLYLTAFVVLLGAEVNAEVERQARPSPTLEGDPA